MKLVEFKYIKTSGDISHREIIELVTPTKFVEGIDVSGLYDDEFAEFTSEMSVLKKAQHEQTMALLDKYDLKHNYRRFIPENMSDVTIEYV